MAITTAACSDRCWAGCRDQPGPTGRREHCCPTHPRRAAPRFGSRTSMRHPGPAPPVESDSAAGVAPLRAEESRHAAQPGNRCTRAARAVPRRGAQPEGVRAGFSRPVALVHASATKRFAALAGSDQHGWCRFPRLWGVALRQRGDSARHPFGGACRGHVREDRVMPRWRTVRSGGGRSISHDAGALAGRLERQRAGRVLCWAVGLAASAPDEWTRRRAAGEVVGGRGSHAGVLADRGGSAPAAGRPPAADRPSY
jgi:hypothetical protein